MSEDIISSLYPSPPPYFKYFSDTNVRRYQEWLSLREDSDERPSGELRLHHPPSVPTGEQYRGYGSVWALVNKLPSLQDSGWRQLYSDEDEKITSRAKIKELHKLLDSLLLNFLELVGSVSKEPAKFHVKVEDLKLILININHLLNTYRPHQTRESLILLLKRHIDEKKKDIEEIDQVVQNIKTRIESLSVHVSEEGKVNSSRGASVVSDSQAKERENIVHQLRSTIE